MFKKKKAISSITEEKKISPLTEKEKAEIWERFYHDKAECLAIATQSREAINEIKQGLAKVKEAAIAAGYYDNLPADYFEQTKPSKSDDTLSQEK